MSGAYCTLNDLIRLRFRAQHLTLLQNPIAKGQLAGGIRSSFKGRGMDFEAVRAYQPGDDIRAIDWRVTARRSKPHTKIFREERERPVMILLDQSHSLFFGSQLNFKSVTACELGGLLAWSTLLHGDRIGGVIFNEQHLCDVRPKRAKKTLIHWLKQAEQLNKQLHQSSMPANPSSDYLTRALQHARRVAHPGTLLFIISDFRTINSAANRLLAQLKRHCEVMAIQVYDKLETELPTPACYSITNGQHQHLLDTRPAKPRQQFKRYQQDKWDSLQTQLNESRIPLLRVCAGQDTIDQLSACFYQR